MNKKEYSEFHKYLALIKYEYIKLWYSENLSTDGKKEIDKVLKAIDTLSQVCLIDKVIQEVK